MAATTFNAASLAPRMTIRYDDTTHGRTTVVVLKDMSILEVKRNGVSAKTCYATFNDWLATLPEGAETALQVNTNHVRSAANQPTPTTDAEWMRLASKKKNIITYYQSLNERCAITKKQMEQNAGTPWSAYYTERYNYFKQRVDAAGPDSEAANYRKPRMRGKPFWVLSTDGSKPEALFFGHIQSYNRERTAVNFSDILYFFYKGKQGATFAEAGVPVDAETGWPNLWCIYDNEFKPIAKPVA